MDSSKKQSKF